MKITIAYTAENEKKATAIMEGIKRICPEVKIRTSDRHSPYKHIYLSFPEQRHALDKLR